MMVFLRKMLVARGVAAAIGVMTSVAAIYLLPGAEYAAASLAVTFSTVGTILLYMPFSKYVLISRNPDEIESIFWRSQALAGVFMGLVSILAWGFVGKGSVALALAGGVFAISQGWKDFSGEVLRVRRQARNIAKLYIYDAATTFLLTIGAMYFFRRAEVLILCSAASSLFWSRRASTPGPPKKDSPSVGSIVDVYRYSFGVVGSSSLNAVTIGLGRTAILKASPMEYVGAIQFILDMLQKAMALFSSAVISSAIPEARQKGVDTLLNSMLKLMSVALALLIFAAIAITIAYSRGMHGNASVELGFEISVGCALLVWANRYKSTLLDLPLLCAPQSVQYLLVGS